MIILKKLLKLVVGLFSVFGIVGFGQLLPSVVKEAIKYHQDFLIFLCGIILYTILWFFYFIRRGNFLEHAGT